jgi:hypothetical protein
MEEEQSTTAGTLTPFSEALASGIAQRYGGNLSMLKKIFAILAVASILGVLVGGCGEKKDDAGSTTTGGTATAGGGATTGK